MKDKVCAEVLERSFDTSVVNINYAEGPPSGPPFVFLHGGSCRWQYYDEVLPDLIARFHLYLPDLRGHGKSGRVPGQYRLQDFANDVVAFLRECVGEPAYLFGHSFSGPVVLLAAALWPDGVRAVVVGDAPIFYVGFIVGLMGWAIVSSSVMTLAASSVGVIPLVLVPFAEEPWLEARYGEEYKEYKRAVPRFIVRLR